MQKYLVRFETFDGYKAQYVALGPPRPARTDKQPGEIGFEPRGHIVLDVDPLLGDAVEHPPRSMKLMSDFSDIKNFSIEAIVDGDRPIDAPRKH